MPTLPLSEQLGDEEDDEGADRQGDENACEQANRSGGFAGAGEHGPEIPLEQHVARHLDPGLRDEYVARPNGEELGHVEPARSAQDGRHPRLQQEALEKLRLGLVLRAGDLDEVSVRKLGLDPVGELPVRA